MQPVVEGGAAEVGLGDQFAPITNGQEVTVELGIQGLWMFVVNGRVRDMDVGSEDLRGVITFAALDANAQEISLEVGCRIRTFVEMPDGSRQLDTAFQLALLPQATPLLDGGMITLRLEVRDHEGRQAIDERTVVARMPSAAPARER
jgi:hypothetical protein